MIIIQVAVAQHVWLIAVHVDSRRILDKTKLTASQPGLSVESEYGVERGADKDRGAIREQWEAQTPYKRQKKKKPGSATIALAASRAYPSHTTDGKCEKGPFSSDTRQPWVLCLAL